MSVSGSGTRRRWAWDWLGEGQRSELPLGQKQEVPQAGTLAHFGNRQSHHLHTRISNGRKDMGTFLTVIGNSKCGESFLFACAGCGRSTSEAGIVAPIAQ